jgi:hypothetical protein
MRRFAQDDVFAASWKCKKQRFLRFLFACQTSERLWECGLDNSQPSLRDWVVARADRAG